MGCCTGKDQVSDHSPIYTIEWQGYDAVKQSAPPLVKPTFTVQEYAPVYSLLGQAEPIFFYLNKSERFAVARINHGHSDTGNGAGTKVIETLKKRLSLVLRACCERYSVHSCFVCYLSSVLPVEYKPIETVEQCISLLTCQTVLNELIDYDQPFALVILPYSTVHTPNQEFRCFIRHRRPVAVTHKSTDMLYDNTLYPLNSAEKRSLLQYIENLVNVFDQCKLYSYAEQCIVDVHLEPNVPSTVRWQLIACHRYDPLYTSPGHSFDWQLDIATLYPVDPGEPCVFKT